MGTDDGKKSYFVGYLVRLGANTNIVDAETVDTRDSLFTFEDDKEMDMLDCDTGIKDYYVSALSSTSSSSSEIDKVSFSIRNDEEDEFNMQVWMFADDEDDPYYGTFDFSFV